MYKTNEIVKQHLRDFFLYKLPLREKRLLENIKSGSLIGYVQCDIKVPRDLPEAFDKFSPIFKNVMLVEMSLDRL